MTEFEIGALSTRLLIGIGQILMVMWGIRQIRLASDSREQAGERQAERRHTEVMAHLEQQGEALRALVRGMETMIERTGNRA